MQRQPPCASADATPRGAAPPKFIPPQLSQLVDAPPEGGEWAHEIKLDGYRMHIRLEAGRARMLTRSGLDWTEKYQAVAAAAAKLPASTAYIDGELCAMRPDGTTSFADLQAATDRKSAAHLVYYAFDLLHLNGEDLSRLPLLDRKARLEPLLAAAPRALHYTEHHIGDGARFFETACQLKVEGVMSKRIDAPYAPGNRGLWQKSKCYHRAEFVIVGFTDPEGSRPHIGALLLGYYSDDGRLIYAGRGGTGMTERELASLYAKLKPLQTDKMPLDEPPPTTSRFGAPLELSRVHWVRPKLVAEVRFVAWTADRVLRHVVYQGLREDKDAREVRHPDTTKADPAKPASRRPQRSVQSAPAAAHPVAPENIMRILPEAVAPPRQLLRRYWRAVGQRALVHLARRPLTLVRHVKGVTFFHKGPLPDVPQAVHTLRIEKREGGEGVRVWVDDVAGLLGLVEMDVVEVHPWGATVDEIEHPDLLVFDLDPGPGVTWEFVTETAVALREMLQAEGYAPWVKTTGGKGLHVMVPVKRKWDWNRARAWTREIAERFARRDRRYILSSTAPRDGKLFLDYLRNGRGSTAIGAFSPRARPGFPVSYRVEWQELERGVRPDDFRMADLIAVANKRRRGQLENPMLQ